MSDGQQQFLFENPPKVEIADPTVPETAKPRLGRQQAAILAALKQGPKTNIELVPIALRYSARIHELRKAGYRIDREDVDDENGVYRYVLKGQK